MTTNNPPAGGKPAQQPAQQPNRPPHNERPAEQPAGVREPSPVRPAREPTPEKDRLQQRADEREPAEPVDEPDVEGS